MSGSIIKRGRAWIVVLDHGRDDNGRRVRKWTYFHTRREAEVYQAEAATHPAFGAGVGVYGTTRLRLSTYLGRWLADYAKIRVRPSTFERYEELVRVHLIPGIGHVQLSRLSPQAIEGFYRKLHGRVSATTAHHIASLLREALKHAVRWGLIVQNPADPVEKPKRDRAEPRLWSFDQAVRFLGAVRGTRYGLLFATLVGTGLRLGEALALQWADVDWDRGLLIVRGGKTTNARRAVLMPDELVKALRRARGVGLIFHRNGKIINQWTLRDNWYALLEKTGLPRIRIHDLRHLHGTFLLQQGADLASVSARLGHASKSFTAQTYIHAMPTGQERAATLSNRLLSAAEACNPNATRSVAGELPIPAPSAGNMVPPAGFEPALPA